MDDLVVKALHAARRHFAGDDGSFVDPNNQQVVTPASLARAWTPPEEALGPEASKFVQTYPEKLGAAMAAVPGQMLETAKFPGQVLSGERSFDPHSDEDIQKAVELAMMAQTGGIGGATARAGETVLGSGPVRTFPSTTIKHEGSGIFRVFHGDEPAGTISVAKNGTGNFISAANLDEPFIGKGIGREAYNLIENEIGRKLAPSPLGISPTASKFWQKRLNEMPAEEKANLFAQTREAGASYGLPERDVNLRLFGIGGLDSLPPIKRADGGHVDAALHVLRRHFDEGGFLDSLRSYFTGGPEVLSTGEKLVDDGRVNWGNSESAADFARAAQADKALRLARQTQDDVTGSTPAAKALARAPIEARELPLPPPPAFTPVSVEDLTPAPVSIPHFNPPRPMQIPGASATSASFATQPIAYSPEAPKNPARAAIDKITTRAPQEGNATNEQILAAIRANESRNNPRAQNPNSSAGGLYQFINSTWGNTLRRMDPEQYGGYSDRQLRGLKTDPNAVDVQHAAANYHLTNEIAPRLERAGVPLTPGSAYLSWFQGPGGAVRAYTAPDDATVSEIFPRTVSANANMRFNGKPYAQWTMNDLRQWADTAMAKRMGRASGGIVDDALHVVREHHADGEAVGMNQRMRETIANIDPERSQDQPVMDPATMGEAWDRARRNYQNFPIQEGEATARQLTPSVRQEIGAAIAGEDGGRDYGSELRRRAAEALVGSSGLTSGMGALDFVPYAGQAIGATDIAHDIGEGNYAGAAEGAALPVAMTAAQKFAGPIGRGMSYAGEKIAEHARPIAGAAGVAATMTPEDAEAANALKLIRAYHGSPHKFDRFDLSKIGTGEGAQAYGHGLYFAEHEPTAKFYRDTLSPTQAINDLPGYSQGAAQLIRNKGDIGEQMFRQHYADLGPEKVEQAIAEAKAAIANPPTGHMYEVGIRADPEHLLNWNKQLKEQPENVVRSLQERGLINMSENVGPSSAGVIRPLGWTEDVGRLSGEKLYRRLIENQLAGFDRKGAEALASKELGSAGIPGIKYLDAGSRGNNRWEAVHPRGGINDFADEASARAFIARNPEYSLTPPKVNHNYVIFNDKLIDINRRYADGGLISRALSMLNRI